MLESGDYATIGELAERERIAPSYMTLVLRLTLLAPDIGELTMYGPQATAITVCRISLLPNNSWILQASAFVGPAMRTASPNNSARSTGQSTDPLWLRNIGSNL